MLGRCRAAAAVLLRPVDAGVAGVEQHPLPRGVVLAAPRPVGVVRLLAERRQRRREPVAQLFTEGALRRRVAQVHGADDNLTPRQKSTTSADDALVGRLDDKVVIVTGAGQGIGEGIALAAAAEGANDRRCRPDAGEGRAHCRRRSRSAAARRSRVKCDVRHQDEVNAVRRRRRWRSSGGSTASSTTRRWSRSARSSRSPRRTPAAPGRAASSARCGSCRRRTRR